MWIHEGCSWKVNKLTSLLASRPCSFSEYSPVYVMHVFSVTGRFQTHGESCHVMSWRIAFLLLYTTFAFKSRKGKKLHWTHFGLCSGYWRLAILMYDVHYHDGAAIHLNVDVIMNCQQIQVHMVSNSCMSWHYMLVHNSTYVEETCDHYLDLGIL